MNKAINKPKKVMCKQNIPNMLVVFRMILTIAIITLLCIPTNHFQLIYQLKSFIKHEIGEEYYYTQIYLNQLIAGCLFAFAAFTDWLDGFLARRNNWVTDFGKLWDPIADKVLINSVLICFAYWQMIPAFIPAIMIARDVAVDADRMVAAKKNVVVAANIYGKLKTIMQMVAIIFVFFFANASYYKISYWWIELLIDDKPMWWGIQNLGMFVALGLSVASGIVYFVQIAKATKKSKHA